MAKKDRAGRGVRREGRLEQLNKAAGGGGNFDCFNTPDGISVFKPEAKKTYHIDVIPTVAGKYAKGAQPGDEIPCLFFPVYSRIGVEEKSYVAIGELTGAKDPVAEYFHKANKAGEEWDNIKGYKPKPRQIMLVFVHEQADKGLQLFESSPRTLWEKLYEEITEKEESWSDNFDDPDGGATLKVRFTSEKIGTNSWIHASKVDLIEREDGFTADGDEELAATIIKEASGICLDDLLIIPDYATLKAAIEGSPVPTEEEEEKPAKGKGKSKAKEEPEEEEEEEEKPAKGKSKGKAAKETETEDDIPFEDEPEEKPAAGKKSKRKPPTAEELGIEKGGVVEHDELGTCTVLKIASDGLTVSIRDDEGTIHRNIDPVDLEPVEEPEEEEEPEEKPAKGKGKSKAKEEPEEEEEEKPKGKGKGKTAPADDKKGKGKGKGGDDGDWDDDWDD